MKKNLLLLILFAFSISTPSFATTILCPASAFCKSNHFYNCDVDAKNFEVTPSSKIIKPGLYIFNHALIVKAYSSFGSGSCHYQNGDNTLSFDIIGKPHLAFEKLPSIWEDDSFRGMHSWRCELSPEGCLFTLLPDVS